MSEGEQNMPPGPEQRPPTGPEQEFELAQTINQLLGRRVNEQGEEIKGSAEIEDKRLRLLAIKAKTPRVDLSDVATKISDYLENNLQLFKEGQLQEDDYDNLERQALFLQNVLIKGHEETTEEKAVPNVDEKPEKADSSRLKEVLDLKINQLQSLRLEGRTEEAERIEREIEEIVSSLSSSGTDPLSEIFRSDGERPPRVEEIGPEEYKKWFNRHLYALLEENRGQSFDANWYLIYPLNNAKNIWPKEGQADEINGGKWINERTGNPWTYSELRRELSIRLEAFRSIHNYIYLHDRASGTGDLISAAHLLRTETIDYLLNYQDDESGAKIADRLRVLEREFERAKIKKEEINKARAEARRIPDEDKKKRDEELEKIKERENQLKNFLIGEMEGSWDKLVSGYLFRGLGEAARHDFIFGSGDFFLARVFNSSQRAKSDWAGKWNRDPNFQEINKACDLRAKSFFETCIKKDKEFFRRNGAVNLDPDSDPNLSNLRFENLNLANFLPNDQLVQARLDIDDAENVRKLIFNPGGLLQRPGLAVLQDIDKVFKHLKGKERYDWYKGMTIAIINYYKDNSRYLWMEDPLLRKLRKSPSQKDFPDLEPWDAKRIENYVKGMTPLLDAKGQEQVLKSTLGERGKRETKKAVKAGADVARSAGGTFLVEFLKALFGQ